METVLLLAGIGFLLLLTEMFLPGGVLGVLGGLLLVAAVAVGYVQLGGYAGSMVLVAILVLGLAGFCGAMAVFPRTAVGKKLTLSQPKASAPRAVAGLVGSEGEAVTALRPSGKALVEGRRLDVVAEGEFVDAGQAIVVTAAEGSRTVVRKKA